MAKTKYEWLKVPVDGTSPPSLGAVAERWPDWEVFQVVLVPPQVGVLGTSWVIYLRRKAR